MFISIIQFITIILLSLVYINCLTFDRHYVGVGFEPYTKDWNGNQIPYFNSYSVEDIKQMLNVINTKFTSISTYGMGVASYNFNNAWDQTDSNCLVARAAAQINSENNKLVLSVSQGIYQQTDDNLMNKEINNAFAAALDANGIFGNTVWSLTFTNEYLTDENSGNRILSMITNNKEKAHQNSLNVGTRINNCGLITQSGPMHDILANIVKESDFLMCNLYPTSDVVGSVSTAAQAVGNAYMTYLSAFKEINPNINLFIGETGWPSEGISFNSSPNTKQNLKDYWSAIGNWAASNQVLVQMFEAIDEPWKSSKISTDSSSPSGPNGAEGHYGLWYRKDTSSGPQYVLK